jgi:DNA-binding FrmR family transcriptional regulator
VIASHKRDSLLRLKTGRGHIDGVIAMAEDEVYCPKLRPIRQASLGLTWAFTGLAGVAF